MDLAVLYIRVAKTDEGELIIKASPRINYESLSRMHGRVKHVYPTVMFSAEFNLDESLFEQAEKCIAEVFVESENVKVCTQINVPD